MQSDNSSSEAFILLGSNINPQANMPQALSLLAAAYQLGKIGKLWYSPAVGGCTGQSDFCNQGLLLQTSAGFEQLRADCKRFEHSLGRRSKQANAPRCMDIDIIFYQQQLRDASLLGYDFMQKILREFAPDCPYLRAYLDL